MIKKALIIGSTGPVGKTLIDYLTKKNYLIFQLNKKKKILTKKYNIKTLNFNLKNKKKLIAFFNYHKNLQIYFLASKNLSSFKKESTKFLNENIESNVFGLINCLEAIRSSKKNHRLIYTGSSRLFESYENKKITEKTEFKYNSYYALTKDFAIQIIKYYRKKYNLFASIAILFTNYSKYTKSDFLIPKIIDQIKNNKKIQVKNNNVSIDLLDSYSVSMFLNKILQLKKPEDLIISSGKKFPIKNIINSFSVKLKKKNMFNLKFKKRICKNNFGSNKKLLKLVNCKKDIFDLNKIVKNILNHG